jgi:hypothetical protein
MNYVHFGVLETIKCVESTVAERKFCAWALCGAPKFDDKLLLATVLIKIMTSSLSLIKKLLNFYQLTCSNSVWTPQTHSILFTADQGMSFRSRYFFYFILFPSSSSFSFFLFFSPILPLIEINYHFTNSHNFVYCCSTFHLKISFFFLSFLNYFVLLVHISSQNFLFIFILSKLFDFFLWVHPFPLLLGCWILVQYQNAFSLY